MTTRPDQVWVTNYPTSQDDVGVEQPDLFNDSAPGVLDGHRVLVEHVHALRNKLQAVCVKVGDDSNLPVDCILDKLTTHLAASNPHSVAKSDVGLSNVPNVKSELAGTRAPAAGDDSDDGFSPGSLWVNVDTDTAYICTHNAIGAAVWQEIGSGGSGGGVSSLDEAYDGGYAITVDGNPVTLNRTQASDDQPSLAINHDFAAFGGFIQELIGTVSGTGTPNDTTIGGVKIRVQKKAAPSEWFGVYGNDILNRDAGGTWSAMSHSMTGHWEDIKGSSKDNIWVVGETSGPRAGRYNGSVWTEDASVNTTLTAKPEIVRVIDTDEVYILTEDHAGFRIYRGQFGSWTNISPSGDIFGGMPWQALPASMAKSGDRFVLLTSSGVWSTEDVTGSPPTWTNDTSMISTYSDFYGGAVFPYGDEFILIFCYTTELYVYTGLPGSWSLLSQTSRGSAEIMDASITPKGEVFAVTKGLEAMWYDLHTASPGYQAVDTSSSPGIYADSATNVRLTSGTGFGKVWHWDGASFTEEDIGTAVELKRFWATTAAGIEYDIFDIEFTGDELDMPSVLAKIGTGFSHIIKSQSGVITMAAVSDPDEESGYASIYPKDVGGVTEWFARDDDSHIMQITNNGVVGSGATDYVGLSDTPSSLTGKEYQVVRVNSGATELEFQKHNMAATAAPQATDDGPQGGYTIGSRWYDTTNDKEYVCLDPADDAAVWRQTSSVLTAKGQLATHNGTDEVVLAVGTDDFVLTADSSQASGMKWAAASGGGSTTFTALTDTPANYTSRAYWGLRVNQAANQVEFQKHNMAATDAPDVNSDIDEDYTIGSHWYDVTNDKLYVCLDNSDGAAVWLQASSVISAKGQIATHNGTDEVGLAVGGTDTHVLKVKASEATGLEWNAVAFTELSDSPANYTGSEYFTLRVNGTPDAIEFQKHKMDGTAPPSSVDDDVDAGYTVGSRWFDITNDKEYVCLDNTDGAAVWKETTQSGGGGGGTHKVETASSTGDETPGTVVVIKTLTGTPGTNANMPSGYDLTVYYDGIRMKYNASPSDYNEFSYNNGTKEVSVYATGTVVDYEVDFWE